jgi:hypothetical protein
VAGRDDRARTRHCYADPPTAAANSLKFEDADATKDARMPGPMSALFVVINPGSSPRSESNFALEAPTYTAINGRRRRRRRRYRRKRQQRVRFLGGTGGRGDGGGA